MRTRLVAVGACAVDTILSVPYFPEEDSKLRTTSLEKRVGGNSVNSLRILQQLIRHDKVSGSSSGEEVSEGDLAVQKGCFNKLSPLITTLGASSEINETTYEHELVLVAVLPNHNAPATRFIHSSLEENVDNEINLRYVLHRAEHQEAVSSYIIFSSETGSRTIVNHNMLPEMKFEEFKMIADKILAPYVLARGSTNRSRKHSVAEHYRSPGSLSPELSRTTSWVDDLAEIDPSKRDKIWFHFEGRIPEVTIQCIKYLRHHHAFSSLDPDHLCCPPKLMISVELEKPRREGLQQLAHEAEVVFYSRAWAVGQGYEDAQACLRDQVENLKDHQMTYLRQWGDEIEREQTLICTWGEQGAYAAMLDRQYFAESMRILRTDPKTITRPRLDIIYSPAYFAPEREQTPVIDTIGAGDTFIAGCLYGYMERDDPKVKEKYWPLEQKLFFANQLAGRKILRNGFDGLGQLVGEAGLI